MQLFNLQRKNKINTSDTFKSQQHFNSIQMVHIECISAHSIISLYCGFKELSLKSLKTASKVLCIVSSIMLLAISTKGCHLHIYLVRENNNTHHTSSKLHKGYFTKESDFCSDSQKYRVFMLLQYSGAALVRDADILYRNGLSNGFVAIIRSGP